MQLKLSHPALSRPHSPYYDASLLHSGHCYEITSLIRFRSEYLRTTARIFCKHLSTLTLVVLTKKIFKSCIL